MWTAEMWLLQVSLSESVLPQPCNLHLYYLTQWSINIIIIVIITIIVIVAVIVIIILL